MSQYLTGLNLLDPGVKRYNGGGTSFTMDDNGTTNGTLLWVDGVAQVPGTDYNVSGATITTTSSTPSGTNNVVSLQLFSTGIVNTPADNTVATAKIVDDAVTLAKMAAGTDGQIITYDASGNPAAVGPGSDGQVLTSTGAGSPPAFEAVSGGAFEGALLHVREEQTSGTNGGTFTSGADRTRVLNTIKTNEISAGLTSNQITGLVAGDYYVAARAPAHACSSHIAWLYDITGTAELVRGVSAQANVANLVDDASWVFGRFTLSGTSTVELRHRCGTTRSTDGLGDATSLGTEVWAEVKIWKV